MKKITPLNILFINILVLFLVLLLYSYTNSDIKNITKEYIEYKSLSVNYKNSKNSFYRKQEVENKIKKILRQLRIKNAIIKKSGKKLNIQIKKISLSKKDKLLNKVFNEKFIIIKFKIEKNNFLLELGL